MLQDLRIALRGIAATPFLAAVVVLSIAIGIGVNLVLFGFIQGMAHEPPAPDQDRLRWVGLVVEGPGGRSVTPPPRELAGMLGEGSGWDGVGAWDGWSARVVVGDRLLPGAWVAATTPGFHQLQGWLPAAGRFFQSEDTLGAGQPALLAHATAVSAFGSEDEALGREIVVGSERHRVVGVLPEDYPAGEFPVHLPLADGAGGARQYARTVVRLREGVPPEQAEAELAGRTARVELPGGQSIVSVRIGGEKEVLRRLDQRRQLLPPFLITAVLLLVAAANLAGVLFSRGIDRHRTLAVRRALGAGHWQMVRPLLLEGALLAMAATAVATMMAEWAFAFFFSGFPAPDAPRLDGTVGLFALTASSAVVMFGVCLPALLAGRVDLSAVLRTGGVPATVRNPRALSAILAFQVIAAVPILLIALSLGSEAWSERSRGAGFEVERLVHLDLSSADLGEATPTELLRRVGEVGAVESVVLTSLSPVADPSQVRVDGREIQLPGGPPPRQLRWVRVLGDPVGSLGVPLVEGRPVTPAEQAVAAPVALVSLEAARILYGSESPLGRSVHLGEAAEGAAAYTVVGVVGGIRDQPLFQPEAPPAIWTPALPVPGDGLRLWARSRVEPTESTVRSVVAAVTEATGVPVPAVRITRSWVEDQMAGSRLAATATLLGALFIGLLCVLGIYGLTAMAVSRRRAELGVRAVCGAAPLRLVVHLLGGVSRPVVTGVLLGMLVWSTVVVSLGVEPLRPGVVALSVCAFFFLLLLAASGPARRIVVDDPVRSLRSS